ncbi:hypothetical protein jhhlp_008782 [Lomentospora prolificans]|uniref:FAD/NAD(P)-binding domain-containing protein n=1 Tax=Lomentospora prolificans TaxID=41688 RepID=A0A2N3MYZ3_9PEZI|nr:hypothetical protein jhhlp_008782 [Lomentospora prolificans]
MIASLKNVVVVGGSYVGLAAVKELVGILPATHRVLLIEPHSHFHHLFAFPRFSVIPNHEHKAFIPYSAAFAGASEPTRHSVVKARALSLHPDRIILDRAWQGSTEVPYDYVVITTGTRLPAPGTMQHDEKALSVDYLKSYQQRVQGANKIVIVGGGAVGVQMATDLKEIYPEKDITLVHSRDRMMPLYHPKMDQIIRDRFQELGVKAITGVRAVVPEGGYPNDGKPFELELKDGQKVAADLVIPATGQIPNNDFVKTLEPTTETPIINPANGFLHVRPTLQLQDPAYSNIFAAGDIADTKAHKAARPGMAQAEVVAKNICALIEGCEPQHTIVVNPPAIHLTLGVTKNMIFRNPDTANGATEPFVNMKDDGAMDMNIEGVWARRGVKATKPDDYHL